MFFMLLLAVPSSATESNSISPHTDTVKCVCDLTEYSCDNFCCCDTDCISSVVASWQASKTCAPVTFTEYSLVYCQKIGDYFVQSNNNDILDPLFKLLCIQYNNAPDWGWYNQLILDGDFSTDVINNIVTKNEQYPDKVIEPAYVGHSSLLPLDRISASLAGTSVFGGYWVLPVADVYGNCVYSNWVLWLESISPAVTCQLTLDPSDISASLITVDDFFTNLRLSKDGTLASLSINYVTITQGTFTFRSSTGEYTVSSAQTICNLCDCSNAVTEAHYTVITNSAQNGISTVYVDLVLENIQTCTVSQVFTVKFFTSANYVEMSGNPGYIIGKNVITAVSSSGNFQINSQTQFFGAASDGSCSNNNYYEGSPFFSYKQDLIYSCYQSFNLADLENFCQQTGGTQYIFNSNSFNYMAKFGNITTSNIDDWVQINQVGTYSSSWSSSNNQCTLTGILVYDVFFTSVGPYLNPQDKIIYVNKYFQNTVWKYSFQDTSVTQKFFFSVVVNFIPYQQQNDPYYLIQNSVDLVEDNVVYILTANSANHLFVTMLLFIAIFLF